MPAPIKGQVVMAEHAVDVAAASHVQDACLSNDEAARLIGVSPRTLPDWRSDGRSPPWVKVGRRVVYRRADFERWLAARVVTR